MFSSFFKILGKKKRKAVDLKGYVQLGADGLFFENLDAAYLNSPTATMALLKFHEYCILPNLLQKYQELWKKIENDYIRYGYYLILVGYDIDGNPNSWDYLNLKKYLVKDFDDNDNAATFINIKSGDIFPTFNKSQKVVLAQFAENGYAKFKGQIYMYNDSSLPYRVTPMYSVMNWMVTEADAATYVNKACDNAMFGNNIFIVKKSSSATEAELTVLDSIREAVSSTKGVEEAAQNLLIEYSGDTDDITKLLSKVSISNDVNVDLLNTTDDKASGKICMACYGFPAILVKQNEGVFGNSGEALTVATAMWSATCLKEAINILDGFKKIGFNITEEEAQVLNPQLLQSTEGPANVDERTLEAQAQLKGSVGGVQSLLAIQQGVASGTTTLESGIIMLETIFGYDRALSIKLLGKPQEDDSNTNPNNGGA